MRETACGACTAAPAQPDVHADLRGRYMQLNADSPAALGVAEARLSHAAALRGGQRPELRGATVLLETFVKY
jgi:hypothetical protein